MRIQNSYFLPLACVLAMSGAGSLFSQTPAPAAPATSPSSADAPSIRLGATLFADSTLVTEPVSKDSDGNEYHPSSFNISRAYLNVTGQLDHRVSFRITPDISRETGSGSSLNGSQTFRLKYGFVQFSLDDWTTKGSWLRLGVQQTPLLDYEESIYRYRFQGTSFAEREGYLTSADAGLAGHYNFSGDYGDVHAGIYNGEGYSKAETNGEKSAQIRASFRPLPHSAVAKGLRVTAFYDDDHFVKNAVRERLLEQITFEHTRFTAGFEHLDTRDRTSARLRSVAGSGWSCWFNPRLGHGWEVLLRHDEMKPDDATAQLRRRNIAGLAYWLPNLQKMSSSLMVDYDSLEQRNYAPVRPRETRVGLKMMLQF